jgi:hypothetical protein
VEELIVKKSGIKYHSIHIYRTSFANGDSNRRRCQERYMLILCIYRGEKPFQKKAAEILVDKQQQQETEFTIVSLDESFFFYDSLVRRVWIDESKRPIVRVTGSHKHIHVFLVP